MNITYKNLNIRNAAASDAPTLGKWWRDGAVMVHAGFPLGLNINDGEIVEVLSKDSDNIQRRLIIEIDGVAVGEMNYRNKNGGIAEIGIKICDSSKQNKGYGKIILSVLIKSLFDDLGYTKIILDTNLDNLRAQHVYQQLGFKKLRVNKNSWKNQLGEPQSSIDYELNRGNFIDFAV